MTMIAKARHSTSDGRRSLLTLVLLLIYMVAFADRQLPAMFGEAIGREFKLDDTALGALHGYGFALIYGAMAVPAGWMVDHMRRLRLVACSVMLWSVATLICGIAESVFGFVAGRLLLGLGQAALVPAAYSLLGDVWPRRHTGIAVAGFAIGPCIGIGFLLIVGGQIANAQTWRSPFLVAGLTGIICALILFRWKEPQRTGNVAKANPTWREVLAFARPNRAIILAINGAMVFSIMAAHAVLAWGIVWLTRSHGLSHRDATLWLGMAVLLGGSTGTIAGGVMSDALARAGIPGGRLTLQSTVALLAVPIAWATFTTSAPISIIALLFVLMTLIAMALVSGPAALQELTPPAMRGIQHGMTVFLVNILGAGLGPLVIGMASDTIGAEGKALGFALAVAVPIMLLVAATAGATGAYRYARCAPGLPSSTT